MNDKANILVVDAKMASRESLKTILTPCYNVYTAEGVTRAIEILDQTPIDLVTVDLNMHELPRIQFLEEVKRHDQDIETIIVTDNGSVGTTPEGSSSGALDYITKPFDANFVLSLVQRALERRKGKLKLKVLRSIFLANVSQDLRGPLSVVVGFVSLLLDQAFGKLTEEQQRALEKVHKSSEEVLALIDNMMLLTCLNTSDTPQIGDALHAEGVITDTTKRYENPMQEKETRISVKFPATGLPRQREPSKVTQISSRLANLTGLWKGKSRKTTAQTAPENLTVLVVKDDGSLRQKLTQYLRRHGYHISTAYSGNAALDMLATEEIRLVLLDLIPPRVDVLKI
ncbi:MAG: response regulator [Candidatus Binatia bacterium]